MIFEELGKPEQALEVYERRSGYHIRICRV